MPKLITYFLSQVIGARLYNADGDRIGKIRDFLISPGLRPVNTDDSQRPMVVGIKTIINGEVKYIDFKHVEVSRIGNRYIFACKEVKIINDDLLKESLLLSKNILDKQIVDINGRKLVRVNDIRLVTIDSGTYAIAVDVGVGGLLRRIGISGVVNKFLGLIRKSLQTHFILWDDVATFDHSNYNIKLARSSSKLDMLHPSDLADIIEEMGRDTRTRVFESLDEEKAADVLEEMEPYAQAQIIDSLPIAKVADVLEKMPADEVADLLDSLEEDKAELLLNEMEKESSEEVRELLEYTKNEVGSLMTTDFISFHETMTVEETLSRLRKDKPEQDVIYTLFVTNKDEKLVATVSLRNLVVSDPHMPLKKIMDHNPIFVFDDDKIDSLAEIISKYNLLAIPVTDRKRKLEGMVVIDDIVEDLLDRRKTS